MLKVNSIVKEIDMLNLNDQSMFDIKGKAKNGRNSKNRKFNNTQLNYPSETTFDLPLVAPNIPLPL
jgi:hypothetical protein